MAVLGDSQWGKRERGDSGPFFARMRAMLVLFSARMGGGGRRGSLQVHRRGWRGEFAGPHLQSFTAIVSF
ncbi:hypothetical protein KY285_035736 [Solanum tuberosum]|nr:hypothetical protein KY289_035949 [Solanum tuberosum]KAH0639150.1 hypothetical protein KY285_035736 [Solanum tuberosum]